MKLRIAFSLLCLGLLAATPLLAQAPGYQKPTEDELRLLLANPSLLQRMLRGATGEQAADVMIALKELIMEGRFSPAMKNNMLGKFSGRMAAILPVGQLDAFATRLIAGMKGADDPAIPALFAGMSVGGGGSAPFIAKLKELANDKPEPLPLITVIEKPGNVLSGPVIDSILALGGNSANPAARGQDTSLGTQPVTDGFQPTPTPTQTTPTPPPPPPYKGQA